MDFPGEKLVIKLWETLAEKGVGSLLSPWQTRREGRVRNELRREELLMLAQAERDAADVRAGRQSVRNDGTLIALSAAVQVVDAAVPPLEHRIDPSLGLPHVEAVATTTAATEAARREINSAKAVIFAEEQLASDHQEPPCRSIDEDWLFAWRDYAGRVSNDDLQRLWGSVLAGEVKSPGKHSIRTLDFLRALSKSEAELIERLAQFVVAGTIARNQAALLSDNGLPFGQLLRLQEIGVLSGVEAVGLTNQYKSVSLDKFLRALSSHDKVLVVEHPDASKTLEFEIFMLTSVGAEILSLGSFKSHQEYLRALGKTIAGNGQGFQVQLADWKQITETQGQYTNAQRIEA